MRKFSLLTIILLCILIIALDAATFYWLQSITQFIVSSWLKTLINILFWIFTIGLVSAILILKVRMETIPITKRQSMISSLYGLAISSFVPKFIFIFIVSILYFSNHLLSETDSVIVVPAVGLIAGFLPFFVIVYAISKAVYRFKVYKVIVPHKDLPKSFDKFRIVHISDLHIGSFEFRYQILENAVSIINELDADLIFFTGDLVNNYAWELNGWEKVLNKLSAKHGKYATLGNHDYGDYSDWNSEKDKSQNFEEIKDFFKKIDFHLLLNEGISISKSAESIAILGVENWGLPPFRQDGDLSEALREVQDIPFKILLSHDPSHWDEEVIHQSNVVLTLAGHTHGMQAGITIMGKQWSPIQYKYKRWAGLYEVENQFLYVTRGLGWLGFPGRLGMRPEITLLEMQKI